CIREDSSGTVGEIPSEPDRGADEKLGIMRVAAWFLLPALASALLLSTTNVVCQDMAVVPFLWVLPLALYLLSFILSFAGEGWYSRALFGTGFAGCSVLALWALSEGADAGLVRQVAIYSLTLFFSCMVCHGELYLLRPPPRRLTSFYLAVAAGGGLGGAFVALLAPLLFIGYTEWCWSLGCCLFAFACLCLADRSRLDLGKWRAFGSMLAAVFLLCSGLVAIWIFETRTGDSDFGTAKQILSLIGETLAPYRWTGALLVCLIAAWVVMRGYGKSVAAWHLFCATMLFGAFTGASCFMLRETLLDRAGVMEQSRSFYGVLRLCEASKDDPANHAIILQHGRITHGSQFVEESLRGVATTYYTERSGVALMLRAMSARGPLNVGVVGLGAGTLAAYGHLGDRYRFYEINPEVVRIARQHFSYLSRSGASVEISLGDARLSLEREASHRFDLLALDAFSSDAIPIHLLTKEAFAIYLRHLRPGGVLAVHISNRFMDLAPVVEKLKKHYGLSSVTVKHFTHPTKHWDFGSDWVLLSGDPHSLDIETVREQAELSDNDLKDTPLWTDDYASILPLLR
ncbi:MAG: fused MFS/spermidine synthase, partial [Opitutaceae bacterium]